MTDYLKPKFTVAVGSDDYRDNWERTFRGGTEAPNVPSLPAPLEHAAAEATETRDPTPYRPCNHDHENCRNCGFCETCGH